MPQLPIYAPNLSKERLGALVLEVLDGQIEGISMTLPARRVAFRAPELVVEMPSNSLADVRAVFQALLFVARGLGGSQFQIVHPGLEMRPRSTAIEAESLERLLIACQGFEIEQVEIY